MPDAQLDFPLLLLFIVIEVIDSLLSVVVVCFFWLKILKQRFQNPKREIKSFVCHRRSNKCNIFQSEHEFRRHSLT